MIKCHLSRLMGERKLKISDVAKETEINRGTITRLYHETFTRIEKKTINTLCTHFNCKIEELFEFIDDKEKK